MIENPSNLAEQLQNLNEAIIYKLKEIIDSIATKQPVGDYATNSALSQKADTSYVNQQLNTKQPTGDYATKTELTTGLSSKVDSSTYISDKVTFATKQELDNYLKLSNTSQVELTVGDWTTGASNLIFSPTDGKFVVAVGGTSQGGNRQYSFTYSGISNNELGNVMFSKVTYTKTEVDDLLANKQNIRTAPLDLGMVGA